MQIIVMSLLVLFFSVHLEASSLEATFDTFVQKQLTTDARKIAATLAISFATRAGAKYIGSQIGDAIFVNHRNVTALTVQDKFIETYAQTEMAMSHINLSILLYTGMYSYLQRFVHGADWKLYKESFGVGMDAFLFVDMLNSAYKTIEHLSVNDLAALLVSFTVGFATSYESFKLGFVAVEKLKLTPDISAVERLTALFVIYAIGIRLSSYLKTAFFSATDYLGFTNECKGCQPVFTLAAEDVSYIIPFVAWPATGSVAQLYKTYKAKQRALKTA